MAEKILDKSAAAEVVMHLNIFAQKVSEVVADYKKVNEAGDTSQEVKNRFSLDCMHDVAVLSDYLVEILTKTMEGHGVSVEPVPSEADVIDLQQYRANGGLLN